MDFTLLCAAKAACKNRAGYFKIVAAAVLGACFAVVFPLFSPGGVWALCIKLFAGVLLCIVAGKFSGFKSFIKFTAAFFLLAFLTGGALIALFSLLDISYEDGEGYLISSVPVGIPLLFVVCLVIAVKKIRKKFALSKSLYAECKIYLGNKSVRTKAFFDSGNKVYYKGAPVSALPKHVAARLVDITRIKTYAEVQTVAGSGKMPIFRADRLEVKSGGKTRCLKDVLFGVSPKYISKTVLHADLWEV